MNWSDRETRQSFYQSKEWKSIRLYVLQTEPLCRKCKAYGYITPADVVDHIIDIKDAPDLRLEITNLQPLCERCHNRKTARDRKKKVKTGYDMAIKMIENSWKTKNE
jgi:5-methylcytosine-specific restriction protein A